MRQKIVGLSILVVIIIVAIVFGTKSFFKEAIVLKGYVGGEKIGFLEDEEVKELLKKKYNIIVDETKAGTYEMVEADLSGMDFLFPSSQIALEIFKQSSSSKMLQSERIFQSPIVLYSWIDIADALVHEGLATHVEGEYYTVDLSKLIDYTKAEGKKWEDIGIDLYGSMKIICTDPNKSNSGNMYAGLLYNMMLEKGATETKALNDLKEMFDQLGFMESSSGTLFESYLIKGKGANPIIAGYENQIVEFAIENPEVWENAKGKVAILVPEPTVWSEHPVIALTENGKQLINALLDEEIQKLAWEKHGFRYPAFQNYDKTVVALPETLDKIIEMPSVEDMKSIMEKLLN